MEQIELARLNVVKSFIANIPGGLSRLFIRWKAMTIYSRVLRLLVENHLADRRFATQMAELEAIGQLTVDKMVRLD